MSAPVAFVAGATGYVGRAVVAALRGRRVTTIAHVRPDSSSLARWRERFVADGALVDTTAWELEPLTAALRDHAVTHVFALLGTTRRRARAEGISGDIYETVDVGLTRLLAQAAARSPLRPRLMYLSSVGAAAGASSAYLRARARAEAAVRDVGLPWLIARPSIITGPDRDDDRPGERWGATVADGLFKAVGLIGGRAGRAVGARYASTTPEILAEALVRHSLETPADRILEGTELRAPAESAHRSTAHRPSR